jgi:hypothetical protein
LIVLSLRQDHAWRALIERLLADPAMESYVDFCRLVLESKDIGKESKDPTAR